MKLFIVASLFVGCLAAFSNAAVASTGDSAVASTSSDIPLSTVADPEAIKSIDSTDVQPTVSEALIYSKEGNSALDKESAGSGEKKDVSKKIGSGEKDGSGEDSLWQFGLEEDGSGEKGGSGEKDGSGKGGSGEDDLWQFGLGEDGLWQKDGSGEKGGSGEKDGSGEKGGSGEDDLWQFGFGKDGLWHQDGSGEKGGSGEKDGSGKDSLWQVGLGKDGLWQKYGSWGKYGSGKKGVIFNPAIKWALLTSTSSGKLSGVTGKTIIPQLTILWYELRLAQKGGENNKFLAIQLLQEIQALLFQLISSGQAKKYEGTILSLTETIKVTVIALESGGSVKIVRIVLVKLLGLLIQLLGVGGGVASIPQSAISFNTLKGALNGGNAGKNIGSIGQVLNKVPNHLQTAGPASPLQLTLLWHQLEKAYSKGDKGLIMVLLNKILILLCQLLLSGQYGASVGVISGVIKIVIEALITLKSGGSIACVSGVLGSLTKLLFGHEGLLATVFQILNGVGHGLTEFIGGGTHSKGHVVSSASKVHKWI